MRRPEFDRLVDLGGVLARMEQRLEDLAEQVTLLQPAPAPPAEEEDT